MREGRVLRTLLQKRWVRFGIGNAAVSLPYLIVLCTLTERWGHEWYLVAAAWANIVYIVSKFFVSKFWAFEHQETDRLREEFWIFVGSEGFWVAFNMVGLYVLVSFCGIWYIYAQFLLAIPHNVITFILSRFMFKPKALAESS